MHSSLIALAFSSVAAASTQGFNYGATTRTGTVKVEADFKAEFSAAKGLANTNGAFSSARLYTMIQGGSTSDPISAIAAAIDEDVKLMLGMWASAGPEIIDNEIAALKNAITKYGEDFTSRVNGISVGSEDLYRITPTGYENDPLSVGAGPAELTSYIKKVRAALAGTALAKTPIGHVDTWTAWQNGSNAAVVEAVDFLGMNTFPYFQTTEANGIENGAKLFKDALAVTQSAAAGKNVIITETGWPVGGKDSSAATASIKNAKTYWDEVGCSLFGKTDVYWYTLVDANTDTEKQPQFGLVGTTLKTTPLFDLTCPVVKSSSSASGGSAATASGSGFAAGSGYGNASATASAITLTSTLANGSVTTIQTSTTPTAAPAPTGTGSGSGSINIVTGSDGALVTQTGTGKQL